jgi:hypothetical protein
MLPARNGRRMGAVEPSKSAAPRSTLGTVALVLTAISVLGLAGLLIGDLAGAEGFEDEESSALADTSWVCFSLGGILALVTGVVAWLRGRNRGPSGDIQAGKIAVGWFVLAILISVVVEALS